MAEKKCFPIRRVVEERSAVPFETVEDAWFWFIQAQQARNDGARIAAGQGASPRPCEPIDILKAAERLYRNRLLVMDHFLVLRHYGRRGYAPDPRRVKEARAAKLWREAMERLEPVLVRKGIVMKPRLKGHSGWINDFQLYENMEA